MVEVRRIKKVLSVCLMLALLVCLAPGAFAVVSQSESFYAADYSNVLKESTEEMIVSYNAQLEQECQGAQIVVVTVDYLNGMYSDEYAYELFNDWGVGSADYNNGMLLLLATQENKAWLAYGLGLQMGEEEASMLLDMFFWDDFDRGDYDGAVNKMFNALLKWYDGEYGSSLVSGQGQAAQYAASSSEGSGMEAIVVLLIVIIILVIVFHRPRRRRSSGFGLGYGLGLLRGSRSWRRPTPPPPPPSYRPPPSPPPSSFGSGFRSSGAAPRRPSTFTPPRSSGRSSGGIGRGGRPGGGMGRGGGGFSGGGAGRR